MRKILCAMLCTFPLATGYVTESQVLPVEETTVVVEETVFCPSMGCVLETCTDPAHYHFCTQTCDEPSHYHTCPENCADTDHAHPCPVNQETTYGYGCGRGHRGGGHHGRHHR